MPKFLSTLVVLALHQDMVAAFGGAIGVRDEGLLDSALAQPKATFGGEFLYPTIYEQVAAYLSFVVKQYLS